MEERIMSIVSEISSKGEIPFVQYQVMEEVVWSSCKNNALKQLVELPLWQETYAMNSQKIREGKRRRTSIQGVFGLHYLIFYLKEVDVLVTLGGYRTKEGAKKERRFPQQILEQIKKLPLYPLCEIEKVFKTMEEFLSEKACAEDCLLWSKIVAYLKKDLSEHVTLVDLKREFFLCEKSISKLCKKQTEQNFREFYTALKIEVAKKQLKERQFSIKEISGNCGYSHKESFHRAFKKDTGCSPREWRGGNR